MSEYILAVCDFLSYVFWSLAYALIAVNAIKNWEKPKIYMPPSVGAICFAWEFTAVFDGTGPLWGHVLWLVLDTVILVMNFRYLWTRKKLGCYALYTAVSVAAMWGTFMIPDLQGMLLSSFLLDAAIVLEYLRLARRIAPEGKLWIALAMLGGDFPAWIGYFQESTLVAVLGAGILLCHLLYISFCLEEQKECKGKIHQIQSRH